MRLRGMRPLAAWVLGSAAVMWACASSIAADQPWWQKLETKMLAELSTSDASASKRADGFTLVSGTLKQAAATTQAAADAPTLEAAGPVQFWAGEPAWEAYVVTAEVKLTPTAWMSLAAACDRSGGKVEPGYEIRLSGPKDRPGEVISRVQDREAPLPRPVVSLVGRVTKPTDVRHPLKPNIVNWVDARQREKPAGQKALAALEKEFADVVGWPDRWFQLRIEITAAEARLWLDGQLLAAAERPKWTRGGVCLTLAKGQQVRRLSVEALPKESAGFLALDLTRRFNGRAIGGDLGDGYSVAAGSLPSNEGFYTIGGVPFRWSGGGAMDSLDVSQTTFRSQDAYIRASADSSDPRRILLRVPKRQYRALAVIGMSDTKAGSTNVLNVRMLKTGRGNLVDSCYPIPAWNETNIPAGAVALPVGAMLKKGKPTDAPGRLWMVTVPLDPGAFQDFLANENEYALELDLTGPPVQPGQPPVQHERVGVHILAATLIESPVEMAVGSDVVGHAFVEPQKPAFTFRLQNTTAAARKGTIQLTVTDFYGRAKPYSLPYQLAPGEAKAERIETPVAARGLHDLAVQLKDETDAPLVRRHTTFAVLPPDDRKADLDSPFGLWVFTDSHYGAGQDAAGELMNKIGVRWSLVPPDPEYAKRYHIYRAYGRGICRAKTDEEMLKQLEDGSAIRYWPQFQETAIGPQHYHYFPPELLEQPKPRPLTEEEEARFKELWNLVISRSRLAREKMPQIQFVFGVGYPQFIATFLSRGFPKEYINSFSLDFIGDRMQMFYYLREVAKHYGYGEVPFEILEGLYVGSDRGSYPTRQSECRQSDIYMQAFIRGLALNVTRFAAASEIWDAGGDYYFSGYGPVGLCHMAPELNPKPGYVAYGTMSRILDQAKYHSLVPTGSAVTYAVRFDGKKGPVYALWTVQGRREIRFAVASGTTPVLTDSQGNSHPLTVADGRATLALGTEPVWLEQAGEVPRFEAGPAAYDESPGSGAKTLASLSDPEAWRLDTTPVEEMQALDDSIPVAAASFNLRSVAGRSANDKALELALVDDAKLSPYRWRYGMLRPKEPIAIPAGTRQLGLWVRGNGAASIDLEVQDAQGRRWTTIQARPSYDFGMAYRGDYAFDGWRYVTFPLAAEDVPRRGGWRSGNLTRGLTLPAKITGIVVQQYAQVVYINTLAPPAPATWALGDLMAE